VLDRLTLAVDEGEAVGVIGPNGAGKTTALNVMAGRLRPDSGRVLFDGRDVTARPAHARCRAGIALTHQIPHPFEAMTVFENVLVGATHGGGRAEGDAYTECVAVLEQSGLAARANTRAGALTLLERKRLELARALATEPTLLLLDEVMAGLNPTEIEGIVALIQRINAAGVSILLIEHNMRAVMSLSHRIAVLNFGEKIVEGAPAEVANHPRVVEAYLGEEYVHAPAP
jgi:branched-chain amino acid transport system ATP-binding protein